MSILSVCAGAQPKLCRERYAQLGLSQRQKEVLEKNRGAHRLHILEGEVDGVKRTLVVLGERHSQNEYQWKEGKDLVSVFPLRAVESFPKPAVLDAYLRAVYLADAFTRSLFGSKKIELDGSISTESDSPATYPGVIDLAHQHQKLAAKVDAIIKRNGLEKMSGRDLERFQYKFQGVMYSGTDLMRLKEIAPQVRTVPIEADYVPTLGQKIASWSLPTSILLDRFWFVPASLGVAGAFYHGLVTPVPPAVAAWGSLAAASFGWAGLTTFVDPISMHRPTLLRGRNPHMAKGLISLFKEDPKNQVILYIAGQDHLPEVLSLLREQGFQSR